MYHNGQVVFDLDKKKPVVVGAGSDSIWAWENVPKNTVPFMRNTGLFDVNFSFFAVYCPKTVEEAEHLLAEGKIIPDPTVWKRADDDRIKRATEDIRLEYIFRLLGEMVKERMHRASRF